MRCSLIIGLLFLAASDAGEADDRSSGRSGRLIEASVDVIEEANRWKRRTLERLQMQLIQCPEPSPLHMELEARRAWLLAWQPSKMPGAPLGAPDQTTLKSEPVLRNGAMPASFSDDGWHKLVQLQSALFTADERLQRKANPHEAIRLATQLEASLEQAVSQASAEAQSLLHETLTFTRYRLARALAYREIPDVLAVHPINDQAAFDVRLRAAYRRLQESTDSRRPEFVLLDVRMYRRAARFGQALILLEEYRRVIEPRWYLKKRRDLLREVGWEAAAEEADRRYKEAGFRDDPLSVGAENR